MVKTRCVDCGKDCTGKRCKDCHIKFSGTSFDFGKWHFDTKKELNTTIKYLLQSCKWNIEFEHEFFKELINKYHEGVKKHNLKVTKFKILNYDNQIGVWEFARDRYRGGILVLGFFEPINKWHGVTVYPHKKTSVKQNLINALRQKWSESITRREPNAKCENGDHPNPQLHHDSISFKEITEECMKYFSEDEIKYGVGDDWWAHESEADAIPNSHPAVLKMLELHKEIKYRWLCSDCHKREHNGY